AAPTLHDSAWEKLRGHSWPGNVRQLQNVLRRACLMCRGAQIMAADLEFAGSAGETTGLLAQGEALAALHKALRWALGSGQANVLTVLTNMLEKELLRLALAEANGNQAQVAKRLGMARGTVIEKLRKYDLK